MYSDYLNYLILVTEIGICMISYPNWKERTILDFEIKTVFILLAFFFWHVPFAVKSKSVRWSPSWWIILVIQHASKQFGLKVSNAPPSFQTSDPLVPHVCALAVPLRVKLTYPIIYLFIFTKY